MNDLDPEKLVFVDEAGIKICQERLYGWAIGRVKPMLTGSRYAPQLTLIGAVGYQGVRALRMQETGMKKPDFLAFVNDDLAPTLSPGEIVVMDNLRSHHNPEAIAAIEAAGARVLFLPPYTPEYNAIEPVWGYTKALVSRVVPRNRDRLRRTVQRVWDNIPSQHFAAWTHHCGYTHENMSNAQT